MIDNNFAAERIIPPSVLIAPNAVRKLEGQVREIEKNAGRTVDGRMKGCENVEMSKWSDADNEVIRL